MLTRLQCGQVLMNHQVVMVVSECSLCPLSQPENPVTPSCMWLHMGKRQSAKIPVKHIFVMGAKLTSKHPFL